MRKRTEAQLDFDYAAHGWAFCNADMLAGKIERLEMLASKLAPTDERHQRLANIKARKESRA